MLFAYIDPAVGSMLLQAMAAVVLAGLVMGRRIIVAPFEWLQAKISASEADREIQHK